MGTVAPNCELSSKVKAAHEATKPNEVAELNELIGRIEKTEALLSELTLEAKDRLNALATTVAKAEFFLKERGAE